MGDWFIHPAFAFQLGSIILGEDVCSYARTAQTLLNRFDIRTAILKRKSDRKVINADDLIDLLHETKIANYTFHSIESPLQSPSVLSFDTMGLREQAAAMRATDILITVHGAGETNMAWMKPCSVVIEV